MKNIKSGKLIVREVRRSYQVVCDLLIENKGYELIDLLEREERPIQSKSAWLIQGAGAAARALTKLGRLRSAERIVMIGNWSSVFGVFMNKVRLVHPNELFWWGFQIRSQKNLDLLRRVFSILYSPNLRFIVFSEYEKRLYSSRLDLPERAFVYQPYGDWDNTGIEALGGASEGDWYFSGGYSNRNYAALIDAWKKISKKNGPELVIIGSKNNADLAAAAAMDEGPGSCIKILFDTASEEFDRYLRGAKACILPFCANTGASGQTVAIRCMRMRKLMISSDTDAMREYIDDGRTGFLVSDIRSGLAEIISRTEKEPGLLSSMLNAQDELFRSRFSYDTICSHLLSVL